MTTTPLLELWNRAGRAARDDRKRLLALYGVLLTPLALVLGSLAFRLLALRGVDADGLSRPVAYVLAPLRTAWLSDADLDLLLYVLLQGLVLSSLWAVFGGAISRMAAVHLATGRPEPAAAALAFARRHWRAFAGAKAALLGGVLVPAALAIVVAGAGRLPGVVGSILLPLSVVVCVAFALLSVVVLSVQATAGFLSTPTVASEDSDAFDAVSRVFGYAAAGLPRLVAVRLLFLCGVLLGSGWRLLRTAGALALGAVLFRAGAGDEATDRLWNVLASWRDGKGLPAGAAAFDAVAAASLALVAGTLLALFAADLVSRVLCARVGAYLTLRQAVDRVPAGELRTAGSASPRLDAEGAGFVEVSRIARDVGSGPDGS